MPHSKLFLTFKLGEITRDHWSAEVVTHQQLVEVKARMGEAAQEQEAHEREVASLKDRLVDLQEQNQLLAEQHIWLTSSAEATGAHLVVSHHCPVNQLRQILGSPWK